MDGTTQINPDQQPGSDVGAQLAAVGLSLTTDLSLVRPYRITTLPELVTMRMAFHRNTGLYEGQYAENSWGFPFIPYPVERKTEFGGVCRVPDNAHIDVIGHPIYWIDPTISNMTQEERDDPARWCVRMFFVIMAMGLWEIEKLSWYNAPMSKGLSYSRLEAQNYMAGSAPQFNNPALIYTMEDLKVPYDEVLQRTRSAVTQMSDIQRSTWQQYRREQYTAYQEGLHLIDEANVWGPIDHKIGTLSADIATAVHSGQGISQYVAPTYEVRHALVNLLNSMERVIILLSAPILRTKSVDSATYSRVVGMIREYDQKIVDGSYGKEIDDIISQMFDSDVMTSPEAFARLYERATQFYMDAWRRLRLVLVNYDRMEKGLEPFDSYTEMEVHEVANEVGSDHASGSISSNIDMTAMDDINEQFKALLDDNG